MRHPDVAAQPDHGWGREHERGGVQRGASGVVMHNFCLLAEDQANGAVQANRGERLIGDVEQQYPTHSHLPGRCAAEVSGHP